jgi:hypothetical protein
MGNAQVSRGSNTSSPYSIVEGNRMLVIVSVD